MLLETDFCYRRSRWSGSARVHCIRKKVELLIQLFDLCCKARFSIFSLGKFEEAGLFLGQDETLDETNTKNIFHNSGSNETMQKVLASIV